MAGVHFERKGRSAGLCSRNTG